MKQNKSYKSWKEYNCDHDCGGCIYEGELCEQYAIRKVGEDNKKVKR